MKALQLEKYGEIKESLFINEIDKPEPQANDVLIEVKASAVTHLLHLDIYRPLLVFRLFVFVILL